MCVEILVTFHIEEYDNIYFQKHFLFYLFILRFGSKIKLNRRPISQSQFSRKKNKLTVVTQRDCQYQA